MLPAFLITFREVIEASLIVATILGILTKLGHTKSIKTVWLGTLAAIIVSTSILGLGSILGIKAHELYIGKAEPTIEGMFMILSAMFITWAVFFLHTYFGHKKVLMLHSFAKCFTVSALSLWPSLYHLALRLNGVFQPGPC